MSVYLTTKEAAQLIGVNASTIRRWCLKDKVPGAIHEGTPERGEWKIPLSSIVGKGRGKAGRPPKNRGKLPID